MPGAKVALGPQGAQLAANAAWSPLFFGQHHSRAALVDPGLNFASLAAYTAQAAKLDRTSAALMAPYLGWLGYASTLNVAKHLS